EEHSRIIGVHSLLTYSILEQIAETPDDKDFSSVIKKGLMRCRRLRAHGYCAPEELFGIQDAGGKLHEFYVSHPRETWKKGRREATDSLLEFKHPKAAQKAGPYEAKCLLPERVDIGSNERIFRIVEKEANGEFVASPSNCNWVVKDAIQTKVPDHTRINRKKWALDSFAKEEIDSFGLRQRISMQFGGFAMANPREAGWILDLAQRGKQHVL